MKPATEAFAVTQIAESHRIQSSQDPGRSLRVSQPSQPLGEDLGSLDLIHTPSVSDRIQQRKGGKLALRPNVRDQRRRAVGAPLADRNLCEPIAVPASGVPTRDDRCIALLGNTPRGIE
jgi:hypothetical protein